jgi:hypothetical protein
MFKFYERSNGDRENDYYCLFLSGVKYADLVDSATHLLSYKPDNVKDAMTIVHGGTVLYKTTSGIVDVFMHLNSKNLVVASSMMSFIGTISEELNYAGCVSKHIYEMLPLFCESDPKGNILKTVKFLVSCRSYLKDGIVRFGDNFVKIDSIPLFVEEGVDYDIRGIYNESLGALRFKKIDCGNYTVAIKYEVEYNI